MGAKHAELRTIADLRFGSGSPATWYIGLSIAVSNPDGSGFTEPTGIGAYVRIAVTNNSTNWPAAQTIGGRTVKKNGTKITFPNPTAPLGTLVEWGAFLALTGGLPLYGNPLKPQISPASGNTPLEFDVGVLELPWGGS